MSRSSSPRPSPEPSQSGEGDCPASPSRSSGSAITQPRSNSRLHDRQSQAHPSNHGSEQSAPPNPIHDASPAAEASPTGPPAPRRIPWTTHATADAPTPATALHHHIAPTLSDVEGSNRRSRRSPARRRQTRTTVGHCPARSTAHCATSTACINKPIFLRQGRSCPGSASSSRSPGEPGC